MTAKNNLNPVPRELREFCRLFNEEKFFEAHEVLELLWRREKQNPSAAPGQSPRDFYQGLIQIAASFVHVRKKNPAGALSLYKSAARYLNPCPSPCLGIDFRALLGAAEKCLLEKAPFPRINFQK